MRIPSDDLLIRLFLSPLEQTVLDKGTNHLHFVRSNEESSVILLLSLLEVITQLITLSFLNYSLELVSTFPLGNLLSWLSSQKNVSSLVFPLVPLFVFLTFNIKTLKGSVFYLHSLHKQFNLFLLHSPEYRFFTLLMMRDSPPVPALHQP